MLLLACIMLHTMALHAAIYTVTNNADSGTGTLRDALTQAAANGSTGINYIYFNLPGVGAAAQTITINTALPTINSSMIIDGTTQPGAQLSVNGAKVIVQGFGRFAISPYCFEVLNADDFEIYGMIVRDFFDYIASGYYFGGAAVSLEGKSSKVIIGAVNKGNVFYDNGAGVLNVPIGGAQQTTSDVAYCEIKANLLGIKEDGITIAVSVQEGFNLSYVHQAVIGGVTLPEGNTIEGTSGCNPYFDGTSILIQNNVFGADLSYLQNSLINSSGSQVYLTSNATTSNQVSQVSVLNNVFGTELSVFNFSNINLQIQSNYFGISPDGGKTLSLIGTALSLTNLKGTVLVGGIDNTKTNIFTHAVQAPSNIMNGDAVIEAQAATTVELSHNSFYCNNNVPFLYTNTTYNTKPMSATLDNLTATSVSGTTRPNARVELFYTDLECTQCQPKTYIASVNADAGGNWVYNAPLLSGYGVMASATLNGISSEFTDPRIYTDSIKILPVTCTSQGSITGAVVVNGHQATWVNSQGAVVSNSPQLLNAPAGLYQLVVSQFGCTKSTGNYTIDDTRPLVNDNSKILNNALCHGSNGSIMGLVANAYVKSVQWLDANGKVVGSNINLTNVKAGAYSLQLTGANCSDTYGPVIIADITAQAIIITPGSEQINPDHCGLNVGSIKNIQISGGGPPYKYVWQNSAGNIVGTGADITGLGSGTYTLNITDTTACDLTTQTYTIDEVTTAVAAPVANNVKVCGNEAVLRVNNPVTGYRYRLYSSATGVTPLDDQSSGVFITKIKATGYYYISQLTGACESARTPVLVTVTNNPITASNAFTPNGDGINDYWQINGLEAYTTVLVQIFNRYGQRVYLSENYAKPFDGTRNGKALPGGTYYYIINLGTGCTLLSGSLTIVR